MKEKRIEKEIKKAQKKGIYNPKLKLGIVALILVIGTVIGVSYAYYTGTSTNILTIKGTVSKKIMVTLQSSENGKIAGFDLATAQTDYGTPTETFKITPNEGYQYKGIICKETYNGNIDVTNKVDVAISNNTLTLTPKTSKDVTCTVEFERVRTLEEIKTDIIKTAKSGTPNFSTGCPTSNDTSCSGVYKITDYSSSTSLTSTNGTSYYFRGKVDNNYVKFGTGTTKGNTNKVDLIWRIVRINGDGSIRLVLDSDIGMSAFNTNYNERKSVGYTYDNDQPCTNTSPCKSVEIATNVEEKMGTTDHGGTNSTIKTKLEKWYYDNLRSYDQYITYGTYCNDTSYGSTDSYDISYYGAYERLYKSSSTVTPQLTCPDPTADNSETDSVTSVGNTKYHTYGGVYKLKIGLLSADEIVLAGFQSITTNGVTTSNYLYYTGGSSFWSMSPSYSHAINAGVFYATLINRYLSYYSISNTDDVRPVINLSTSGLKATGEGTKDKPFVISP